MLFGAYPLLAGLERIGRTDLMLRCINDSSAAAIAACGMTEIYKQTGDKVYLDEAKKLIDACDKYFCSWDDAENEALLDKGCVRYSEQRHIALIYGDYYFFHAVRESDKVSGE